MEEFDITIVGRPIPFKRTTQRQKWVDKSYHKYRDYKTHIKECILEVIEGSFKDCTVRVSVNVYLAGGGMYLMGRDGDIDNYIKTALDAMNNIVFLDDRQVMAVCGRKRQCEKGNERMEIKAWKCSILTDENL